MKNKIPKIILWLTFLPYPLIVVNGIYAYFNGCTFMFSTTYGSPGMFMAMFFSVIILCIIVPVIPVCLLYDIIYALRKTIWKDIPASVFYKRVFAFVTVITIVIGIGYFGPSVSRSITRRVQRSKAEKMISSAEEEIAYDDCNIYADGLLGLKNYRCSTLFFDYDTITVGFLTSESLGEYHEYKLDKSDKTTFDAMQSQYYTQAVIVLKNGILYAFSESEGNSHYTYCLAFIDNDGSIYTNEKLENNEYGVMTFLYSYYYCDSYIDSEN